MSDLKWKEEKIEFARNLHQFERSFNRIGSMSLSVMIGMLSFAILGLSKFITTYILAEITSTIEINLPLY